MTLQNTNVIGIKTPIKILKFKRRVKNRLLFLLCFISEIPAGSD